MSKKEEKTICRASIEFAEVAVFKATLLSTQIKSAFLKTSCIR